MKLLSVSSEVFPLVKTGGLADVVGALPRALAGEGIEAKTLVPGYPAVLAALPDAALVGALPDLFGGPARVLAGRAGGLDLIAIDAPHLYARGGNPYLAPSGQDWADNPFRFAALARLAASIGLGDVGDFRPDVVHAHDWQAGLAPAYLRYDGRPAPPSVVTIHNLAFQGRFPRALLPALGLPARAFTIDGVESYGAIGFLKAGLQLCDRITTVSPTYAQEIQTAQAGFGLDGLLRFRADALTGILNGIGEEWNPATDERIPARYDRKDPRARAANKRALQARFGLEQDPEALLFGSVSRLSWQKGLDLLLELPAMPSIGTQLAVLGSGDAALEERIGTLARQHPGRLACVFGYDEDAAHLIQAGADALLVPSRFEPCGLTQLCALRYGAIPVVSRVGGLADSVIDTNEMARAAGVGTGIVFSPVTAQALAAALRRTAGLWRDRAAWARMQENAMATDVSWTGPARGYAALYRELAG